MVDYREILRLDNLGYTKKDIASNIHSSRNTVSEVLTLAANFHVCWPLDDARSKNGSRYTDCSIIIQLKQQDG